MLHIFLAYYVYTCEFSVGKMLYQYELLRKARKVVYEWVLMEGAIDKVENVYNMIEVL